MAYRLLIIIQYYFYLRSSLIIRILLGIASANNTFYTTSLWLLLLSTETRTKRRLLTNIPRSETIPFEQECVYKPKRTLPFLALNAELSFTTGT